MIAKMLWPLTQVNDSFFTVTLRPFIKKYQSPPFPFPPSFLSRNIIKNAETHPPPLRDVIIEQPQTINILGIHFYYNKNVENEEDFIRHVSKSEKILKLWIMKNFTVKGKITVFKTLAISKTMHLSVVLNVNYQRTKKNTKIIYLVWKQPQNRTHHFMQQIWK